MLGRGAVQAAPFYLAAAASLLRHASQPVPDQRKGMPPNSRPEGTEGRVVEQGGDGYLWQVDHWSVLSSAR
jgi:hypothetical protein